jgi:hypothetical protein
MRVSATLERPRTNGNNNGRKPPVYVIYAGGSEKEE